MVNILACMRSLPPLRDIPTVPTDIFCNTTLYTRRLKHEMIHVPDKANVIGCGSSHRNGCGRTSTSLVRKIHHDFEVHSRKCESDYSDASANEDNSFRNHIR